MATRNGDAHDHCLTPEFMCILCTYEPQDNPAFVHERDRDGLNRPSRPDIVVVLRPTLD
jgi:hypothetical protein